MKRYLTLFTSLGLTVFLFIPIHSDSFSLQKRVGELAPNSGPKITGSCILDVYPHNTIFTAEVKVMAGDLPFRGLKIKVQNHELKEFEPGKYRVVIQGYKVIQGDEIFVFIRQPAPTFQYNHGVKGIKGFNLDARIVFGKIMQFVTPANEARISIKDTPMIDIVWKDNVAPIKFQLYEAGIPQAPNHALVQMQEIVPTKISIPTANLQKGKKYTVSISETMGNFLFDAKPNPEWQIKLIQSVKRFIHIK